MTIRTHSGLAGDHASSAIVRRGPSQGAKRLETTGTLTVELEEARVDVEPAEDPHGNRFVSSADDSAAIEVAAAHVRRDQQVVGTPGYERVHRVSVPHDHLVGIVATGLHLLAEVGITERRKADVVELHVPTSGRVERWCGSNAALVPRTPGVDRYVQSVATASLGRSASTILDLRSTDMHASDSQIAARSNPRLGRASGR